MMADNFPVKKGIYEKTLTLEDGKILRYALSIPKSLSTDGSVPLVVALHYGGRVTPYYGKEFLTLLVYPALERLGAVMVAPDCPARGWDNPYSENAVIALINQIKKNYTINDKKVLITGFSMGAIGTWYMTARHPHLFTAAIPISGMPNPSIIGKNLDMPVYVIHSRADEIFPIKQVRETITKLKARCSSIKLIILDRISHYQTGFFVESLRRAIPWIKQVWKNKAD
jgi:predicted peptidase